MKILSAYVSKGGLCVNEEGINRLSPSSCSEFLSGGDLSFLEIDGRQNFAIIFAYESGKSYLLKELFNKVSLGNRNSPIGFVNTLPNSIIGKAAKRNHLRTYNGCFCGEGADIFALVDCFNYIRDKKGDAIVCYLEDSGVSQGNPPDIYIIYCSGEPAENKLNLLDIEIISLARIKNIYPEYLSTLNEYSCLCFQKHQDSKEPDYCETFGRKIQRKPNFVVDLIDINSKRPSSTADWNCLMKRNDVFYLIKMCKN